MAKSYKHSSSKRAHIPSKEEAGYESANPNVRDGEVSEYDKNPKYFSGNPVDHRGKDPELWWMNKYGPNNADDKLNIDIRSVYRHEHIAPEKLIQGLYKTTVQKPDVEQGDLFANPNALFGNALEKDELEKVSEYYKHSDGWSNRLIQGDSLLVMNSLLEREGMAGQVQTIYIDPPYGIKYNSNWQMKLNDRNVKDGSDEHLSGEPEMIKAFRDTWELGIHSYLSYLRDRLITARELLTESGSCFVQISDENVHLMRSLMDEVFGSENFMSMIIFKTTAGKGSSGLDRIYDCIIWYSKDHTIAKYRQLYGSRDQDETDSRYAYIELNNGEIRRLSKEEKSGLKPIPSGNRFRVTALNSQGETTGETSKPFEWKGTTYSPPKGRHWSVMPRGLINLDKKNRLIVEGKSLCYKRYLKDYPVSHLKNVWFDVGGGALVHEKQYVVQTTTKVIQRCILMTTDPGDLILDPTCGSGTTAYVAEQWGRRWITIDTSRIALNIAKTRLMTATFPYFHLHSEVNVEKTNTVDGKIKKKISPKAEGDRWLVEGENHKIGYYDSIKKLSGAESLEAINKLSDDDIQIYGLLSQRRDLWLDFADQEGGGEHSGQHSRGPGQSGNERVSTASGRGPVFFSGSRDLDDYLKGIKLSEPGKLRAYLERMRKYFETDQRLAKRAHETFLATIHRPLTTKHLSPSEQDIRQGFVYEEVPHITLKSLANDEPPATETLYDKPFEDKKKLRVAGPFTVETLQNFEPISPADMPALEHDHRENEDFEERVFEHLRSAGVKNGIKNEMAQFIRVERLASEVIHAEGFFKDGAGKERKAYLYIGPKFGTVSKKAVNEAVKDCRQRGDADWLIILGFSFESDIKNENVTMSVGNFEVTKVRMHDDLMQDGLLKKDKKAGSFITIGEPDVRLNKSGDTVLVEIAGLDIYDPIKDVVKSRNVQDIAYWMVDDDYDGSNFVVKQVFFCGGSKDEFKKWQNGISHLASQSTKKKAEATLKIEIDDEAFDRLYGFVSHPIPATSSRKIAVRVVSQFGEESMKILEVK